MINTLLLAILFTLMACGTDDTPTNEDVEGGVEYYVEAAKGGIRYHKKRWPEYKKHWKEETDNWKENADAKWDEVTGCEDNDATVIATQPGDTLDFIRTGLTTEQVRDIVGRPSEVSRDPIGFKWTYEEGSDVCRDDTCVIGCNIYFNRGGLVNATVNVKEGYLHYDY
ncbi:MAG: hypothetical protein DRP08_03390 [Candidatus Aenigmatarchaeota archaeon]|nr:MAG: hypothetical protein DRP08_03390 [Candidatus Aenigmarchaeota archaeon]